MQFIVMGFLIFFMILFPKLRCVVLNPFKVIYYLPIDLFFYFKHKKYNECKVGIIVALMGLFGKGKTLTAVHIVAFMYKRKDGKMVWCMRRKKMVKQRLKIISNVNLLIPFEKFVSMEQVVLSPELNVPYDDENDTLTVTLILLDEASVQMNSRTFKQNVDPLLLNSIMTCRHNYLAMYYTAPRYQQVDALLRQVTHYCIDCLKTWRLQGVNYYDAWEMENATSPLLLKPYNRSCWFVSNKDYEMYDTLATVENLKKSMIAGDMMSSEEILALQCNNPNDMSQVMSPSRKYKKVQKKMYK